MTRLAIELGCVVPAIYIGVSVCLLHGSFASFPGEDTPLLSLHFSNTKPVHLLRSKRFILQCRYCCATNVSSQWQCSTLSAHAASQ